MDPLHVKAGAATIWQPTPSSLRDSAISSFRALASQVAGAELSNYEELHKWSVTRPAEFWRLAFEFLALQASGDPQAVMIDLENPPTPLCRRWFPDVSLNFAQNLIAGHGDDTAIVSWSETELRRSLTRAELTTRASAFSSYLRANGIGPGDRVFAFLPNIPEAVSCMLGTALAGATWSSCGPDYQVDGLLNRAERIQPKVLVAASSYLWRGERRDLVSTVRAIVEKTSSIDHLVMVDYLGVATGRKTVELSRRVSVTDVDALHGELSVHAPLHAFSHPLYIMFSSGTTGKPKAIVHSAGGSLLEHKKELILHSGVQPGDSVFYQTSTSWMMWNWLVSALACDASIVLYDGDPLVGDGLTLWKMADAEAVSHFGTSAAFLGALEKRGIEPRRHVELNALRAIMSTGSTLYPEQFDFILAKIKDLWIQSISGGTDIIGCFGLGCPILPVRRGEVQCKSLGYDVQVLDESGRRVTGKEGELVCAAPAPSMPTCFLDDEDGQQYRAAYFNEYPGIWRHGDYVIETDSGGLIFLGRSDSTLKPSGVRVATADIYSALHAVPEIQHAMAVGYTPPGETSERIVLFVVVQSASALNEALEQSIKDTLRRVNAFYVPHLILSAPELPRTSNNKLAEMTVKRILKGDLVTNAGALANPGSLIFFETVAKQAVLDMFS